MSNPAGPYAGLRAERFGALEVLKGVDLTVRQGEINAVIEPSGSGKSTLLSCLIHLGKADSGAILIEGEPILRTDSDGTVHTPHERQIRHRCRRLGMVFQIFHLFRHRTALQNVNEVLIALVRRDRDAAEEHGMARLPLSSRVRS